MTDRKQVARKLANQPIMVCLVFKVPVYGIRDPLAFRRWIRMNGKSIQHNTNAVVKRRIPSPLCSFSEYSGTAAWMQEVVHCMEQLPRRPGRGGMNKEELFFDFIPSPQPSPGGRGGVNRPDGRSIRL
jgi:hypothetical protein